MFEIFDILIVLKIWKSLEILLNLKSFGDHWKSRDTLVREIFEILEILKFLYISYDSKLFLMVLRDSKIPRNLRNL